MKNTNDQNQNNETKEKAPLKERAKAWWSKHKFKLGCLGFLILGIITAILGIKAKEAFELPDLPELPDPDEGEEEAEDEEPPAEDDIDDDGKGVPLDDPTRDC